MRGYQGFTIGHAALCNPNYCRMRRCELRILLSCHNRTAHRRHLCPCARTGVAGSGTASKAGRECNTERTFGT